MTASLHPEPPKFCCYTSNHGVEEEPFKLTWMEKYEHGKHLPLYIPCESRIKQKRHLGIRDPGPNVPGPQYVRDTVHYPDPEEDHNAITERLGSFYRKHHTIYVSFTIPDFSTALYGTKSPSKSDCRKWVEDGANKLRHLREVATNVTNLLNSTDAHEGKAKPKPSIFLVLGNKTHLPVIWKAGENKPRFWPPYEPDNYHNIIGTLCYLQALVSHGHDPVSHGHDPITWDMTSDAFQKAREVARHHWNTHHMQDTVPPSSHQHEPGHVHAHEDQAVAEHQHIPHEKDATDRHTDTIPPSSHQHDSGRVHAHKDQAAPEDRITSYEQYTIDRRPDTFPSFLHQRVPNDAGPTRGSRRIDDAVPEWGIYKIIFWASRSEMDSQTWVDPAAIKGLRVSERLLGEHSAGAAKLIAMYVLDKFRGHGPWSTAGILHFTEEYNPDKLYS